MARVTKAPLYEKEYDDLGGGLNEGSPPIDVSIRECLSIENWRVAENGRTKKKRRGLSKIDDIYSFGTKKQFGIFGIEEPDEIELAAFLEDDIQLKSGDIWNSVFSPTKTIEVPASVVQDKGLVFVVGYEKPIVMKESEVFYAGVIAPQTAPTVALESSPTDTKVVDYPSSNQDHLGELGALAGNTLLAQSFKVSEDYDLSSVILKLKKIGSPTGAMWVEIHEARGGTSASKEASTFIVGEASDEIDVSTIAVGFVVEEASTIAFVSATKKITDSGNGLAGFLTGNKIKVTGSAENDGIYTVATGGVAGEIVVSETLVDENAGDSITIDTVSQFTFSGTAPSIESDKTYYIVVYRDFTVSSTNHVLIGFDGTEPDHSDGRYWKIDGSLDWTSHGNKVDLVYEVYGVPTESKILLTFGPVESGSSEHLRDTNDHYLIAQSFKLPAARTVEKIRIPLKKNGSPTGDIWLEIHSSQAGTSEDYGLSTNIVGDPSDVVDVDDITEDFSWIEFTFSGSQPSLSASTTYYLVLYCEYTVSTDDYIEWTLSSGYADGSEYDINDSMTWAGPYTEDASFEIEGSSPLVEQATEYALANLDDIKGLRETTSQSILAQKFQVLKASDCSKVTLYLCKKGSPTGNIWAEIHSAQGETSATKDVSTNIVGEASDNVDVSTLNAFPTYASVTFAFSGVQPTLELNKDYYLVLYGSFTVSTTNYVMVGRDKVDPEYSYGRLWEIDDSQDWTEIEGTVLIFEVYLLASDLAGDYSYVVTFLRGGNFPCESNPSPATDTITLVSGKIGKLTDIPVSSESQVTDKNIYRVLTDGAIYYWLARIPNATTDYEDSIPDAGLGDEVSFESYVPPAGNQIEIWDDKSWISGVKDFEEGLFLSRTGYLEQFPTPADSYVPLREDQSDRVVRPKEFNNYLYPFKSSSIWVISRSGTSYAIDKLVNGTGLGAAASLTECNVKGQRSLVFLTNYYKIGIFDGFKLQMPLLSVAVKDTLASINKDYAYRSVGHNNVADHEYRLSIPTGSSIIPNKTIVLNYLTGNMFIDTYHQDICSISVTNISLTERAMVFGTDQGEALKVDSDATTDDGQIITADFRTGWEGRTSWRLLRRMFLDYVLPENKTLVFKVYSNFRETPDLTLNLDGNTPAGANPSFRDVIHKKINMGVQGSFYSFQFIHAEDAGDDVEIIKLSLYFRRKKAKETIQAT